MPNMIASNQIRGRVAEWLFYSSDYGSIATAIDTVSASNGVVTGATFTTGHLGEANGAYSFNGVTHVVRVADSAALNLGANASVFGWFKSTNRSQDEYLFGQYDFGVSKRSWALVKPNGGYFTCFVSADGGSTNFKNYKTTNTVLNSTNWYHIGFVFSANTLKLYVDGSEITSLTKATDGTVNSLYNADADVTLGCGLSSNTLYNTMVGNLQDVRIYNTTLTQQNVTDLYNGVDFRTGLVAHYPLNVANSRGSLLTDISGTARHLTMNNMTWTADAQNRANRALLFDGTSSYLEGNALAEISNALDFTIVCLFKTGSDITNKRVLISNHISATNKVYLAIQGTRLYFSTHNAVDLLDFKCVIAANTWYYMTAKKTGNTLSVYYGTTSQANLRDFNSQEGVNGKLRVGLGISSYFNGTIAYLSFNGVPFVTSEITSKYYELLK